MKILFSALILIQCYSKIIAQNLIFELPIVGDTIDYEEKVKFVLFPEIPNNDYLFSIISERNSDTLITHYKKNDTSEIKINYQDISSILNNITKLNDYYNSINNQKKDTIIDYSRVSYPYSDTNYKIKDSLVSTHSMNNGAVIKKTNKKPKWYEYTGPPVTDKEIRERVRSSQMMGTYPKPPKPPPSFSPR